MPAANNPSGAQPVQGQDEFDYIIIGAGASGSVITNRLTTDLELSVMLLEAGGPEPGLEIDQDHLLGSEFDWKYQTEPEPQLANRRLYWPRGKVMGGSSTISSLICLRGNRLDYDHWNYHGNLGWSYTDVLPYFKKSESNAQFHDEFHGGEGPLNVELVTDNSPLKQAFAEAAENLGFKGDANWDFNGAKQEGVAGLYQKTLRNGKRESVASAFLTPVLNRPRLMTRPFSLVSRLIWENDRIAGVEYLASDKQLHVARARREVIVCAGAVDSPRLLMSSGIGPAEHLRSHGISVKVDLPGVGQNLQDHLNIVVMFKPSSRAGAIKDRIGTGGLFLRTKQGLESASPDLKLDVFEVVVPQERARFGMTPGEFYCTTVCLARPQSRGSVALSCADPTAAPLIRANYLQCARDLEILVDGTELVRQIAHTNPLGGLLESEQTPGLARRTKQQIEEFVRMSAATGFHPAGTCKMGHDAMAVVDDKLRVHGVEGLRVADASIMPTVVNANTIAPCVMIGEKAADLIKNGR